VAARRPLGGKYGVGWLTTRRPCPDGQAAENAVLAALANAGFYAPSIDALAHAYPRIPPQAAAVLLGQLDSLQDLRTLEMVVRVLALAKDDFDPAPMLSLFERTTSEFLRWAISNTLAEARPRRAAEWIARAIRDQSLGQAREMLGLALARTNPPAGAIPLLIEFLGDLPGHAALGLAECGTPSELPALAHAAERLTGWQKRGVLRAIARIEKRNAARR
jgi:hypothetical protein